MVQGSRVGLGEAGKKGQNYYEKETKLSSVIGCKDSLMLVKAART